MFPACFGDNFEIFNASQVLFLAEMFRHCVGHFEKRPVFNIRWTVILAESPISASVPPVLAHPLQSGV